MPLSTPKIVSIARTNSASTENPEMSTPGDQAVFDLLTAVFMQKGQAFGFKTQPCSSYGYIDALAACIIADAFYAVHTAVIELGDADGSVYRGIQADCRDHQNTLLL